MMATYHSDDHFASSSWDQPRCLIESRKDRQLEVNEQTLSMLQQITDSVVVVAIVGLYRTGKSYLMNRLAGRPGFDLGSTVQSKTKGIWVWAVRHPTRRNCSLLLLDTEGLGDVEKGDANHNTWIFALAVLLGSTLVYNSMGTIDQNSLEKLHFVTEMSEHIKIKSNGSDDESAELRDFTLDLVIDGKTVTEDEYLEHALQMKSGAERKVADYNLPRQCIRTYFPWRRCFTFPRPLEEANSLKLKILESLKDSQLKPEFLKESEKFLQHVFDSTQPKSANGRSINGPQGKLLETPRWRHFIVSTFVIFYIMFLPFHVLFLPETLRRRHFPESKSIMFIMFLPIARCALVETPLNAAVMVGSDPVEFKCKSDQGISLKWLTRQNQSTLILSNGYSIISNESESFCSVESNATGEFYLKLTAIREAAQTYICQEPGTNQESSADLIIIEREAQCETDANNSHVIMKCDLEFCGNWAPELEWRYNGKLITEGVNAAIVSNKTVSSTLTVPVSANDRKYTCTTRFDIKGKSQWTTSDNIPDYESYSVLTVKVNHAIAEKQDGPFSASGISVGWAIVITAVSAIVFAAIIAASIICLWGRKKPAEAIKEPTDADLEEPSNVDLEEPEDVDRKSQKILIEPHAA